MAAPAFGTAGTQLQGTGSTMNVDVPDSVAVGDIIVVTAFTDTPGGTVTGLATDFAQAPDSPVSGGSNKLYVMWKRATAADSTAGTYDFTLSGSIYRNAQAIRYTGAAASGDPWDVTASAIDDTSGTVTPAVSDTTTVADTLLVFAGTDWAGGTWTPPSSFTERRDSGDGVCTVADLAQAAPGATGSVSATCTGSDRRTAWIGALKSDVAADTGGWSAARRLPGRIGPDGKVFIPVRFDLDTTTTAATNAAAVDAAATGTAQTPSPSVAPTVGQASATGTAQTPSPSVAPTVGQASATGTAQAPTVKVSPTAGQAAATGVANNTTSTVAPTAGQAAATGTAQTPTRIVATGPTTAAGTGTAFQPTVQTGSFTNAAAGTATATGTANTATATVAPTPATAAAAGTANVPARAAATGPGTAAATGQGFDATVAISHPGAAVTPPERWLYVPAEPRSRLIAAEPRTVVVRRQERVVTFE